MINVTINIESVFTQFKTANELKEVAQSVINQVSAAYKARLAEIQGAKTEQPTEIVISTDEGEQTTSKSSKGNKKAPTKPKTPSKTKTPAKEAVEEKTKKKTKEVVKQVLIASLTKAQIKAMNIKFEKYSDKCMCLTGNTRSIKDEIKAMSGVSWDRARQKWYIKNASAQKLAKALKIKIA